MVHVANAPQAKSDAAGTEAISQAKDQLARAQIKVSQLEVRVGELTERQQHTRGAEQQQLGRDYASSMADLRLAHIARQRAEQRLNQLLEQQDGGDRVVVTPVVAVVPPGAPARAAGTTIQRPRDDFFSPSQVMDIMTGGAILLLPFVIVLARKLWVRGSRRPTLDPENSPRLQRIEEAVEAIALEVERIGEAQRFTTKLLVERQPDAVGPVAARPRREPGTITPH
jgi:hypothetical protein